MDFFEKLSKKATETYKNVADKTNKLASESNIKSKMNDDKKKISVIYTEIGKKVYQRYATDGTLDVKNDIQEELNRVDELAKGIEKAESELLTLSGMKKCVKCNQSVPIASKFCPSCGAEQPETVTPTAEAVQGAETTQNAEAKEIINQAPIEKTAEETVAEESSTEQEEKKTAEEVSTEVEAIVDEAVKENAQEEKVVEEKPEEEKVEVENVVEEKTEEKVVEEKSEENKEDSSENQ